MKNLELISLGLNLKELFSNTENKAIDSEKEQLYINSIKSEMESVVNICDVDCENREIIIDELDSLGVTYKYLLDSYEEYFKKTNRFVSDSFRIPYALSLKILGSPLYNKRTGYNYRTIDSFKDFDGDIFNSRFTYVLDMAFSKISNTPDIDEDTVNEIYESVKCLLFEVANTFHPNAVANIYYGIFPRLIHTFGDRCKSDIIQIFETLVIAEGNKLNEENYIGNEYKFTMVFDMLSEFVFNDVHQILDDVNHYNWFNTILSNSNYNRYRKEFYTKALLNLVIDIEHDIDRNNIKQNNMIFANRYIRQKVTEWIKMPDVSKRPEVPEVYNYINIIEYLEKIYEYGLYVVGDIDKRANEFDNLKEDIENSISDIENKIQGTKDENELKDLVDKKEKLSIRLSDAKAEEKHMLTLESLISFVFIEILSNETLADLTVDDDFILSLVMHEPDIDNAMHVTHNNICSLYFKRDYNPAQTAPINPHFVHIGEGTSIASERAKFLAKTMSITANYNAGSRINCSACLTPRELVNLISTLKYSLNKVYFYNKNIIINELGYISGANNIIRNHASMYKERLREILGVKYDEIIEAIDLFDKEINKEAEAVFVNIEGRSEELHNDIVTSLTNMEDMLKRNVKKIRDMINVGSYSGTIFNELVFKLGISDQSVPSKVSVDQWFDNKYDNRISNIKECKDSLYEAVSGIKNTFKVIDDILNNLSGYIVSKDVYTRDEKRDLDNLWPIITQVDIPVVGKFDNVKQQTAEEIEHEKFMDIKPGDIKNNKYRTSRFTSSDSCD